MRLSKLLGQTLAGHFHHSAAVLTGVVVLRAVVPAAARPGGQAVVQVELLAALGVVVPALVRALAQEEAPVPVAPSVVALAAELAVPAVAALAVPPIVAAAPVAPVAAVAPLEAARARRSWVRLRRAL